MEIHWRAPIQAKGFLKIIEIFIALLAFSLIAGFSVTHTTECQHTPTDGSNITANINVGVKYPFDNPKVSIKYSNDTTSNFDVKSFPSTYKQSAQFFVVWGIFSMFYGIIAIIVYMLTTANAQIEWIVNYLVLSWRNLAIPATLGTNKSGWISDLGDVVFHIVWVLCWLIASIDWAVAQVAMKSYIGDTLLDKNVVKEICIQNELSDNAGSYVQAAIGDVFGFTSVFLWGINIYWVILDTSFYLQWKNSRQHTAIDDD